MYLETVAFIVRCCDVSGHVFWTFEINAKYHRCFPTMINGKIIPFMVKPFNHLRFVTYCLLPFVYILTLNILIVARLRWTPLRLKPSLAGNNPPVSIGLEASSVGMATTEGGTSSRARIANISTSASASAVALRQQQQARPLLVTLVLTITIMLKQLICTNVCLLLCVCAVACVRGGRMVSRSKVTLRKFTERFITLHL